MPKITQLTADTSPTSDDLAVIVNDPAGTPGTKKATLANVITKAHGLTDGIVSAGSGTLNTTLSLDTDGTLVANSDTKIASQKAVKTYADNVLGNANALVYKGTIDCSTNPNYPAADAGFLYVVSVAGKIGGASGIDVEVGDMLICNTDGTASGNQATVGQYWNIIQKNIVGAVTGPASSTADDIATFDGATGKVIKDSGNKISDLIIKATPQIGGNLDLNGNALSIVATAGENLVAGNLCYLKSDGKYWKASHAAASTSTTRLAIANGTINTDATGTFIVYGTFTTTGLTAGSNYFVGTAGAITTTTPTTEDYVIRPIGTALSTTKLEFQPSTSWITYKP